MTREAGRPAPSVEGRSVRRPALSLGLLVGALVIALLLAEAVLRITGFEFEIAPESVEFGWPNPEMRKKLHLFDPDLFWVPKSYYGVLVRLAEERPDIVFLGDSCTEFGAYPRLFVERMQAHHPDAGILGAKLGVAGWTSHQGLRQLERDVVPLRPRVVSFYFGWNDHWTGFGVEDDEIHPLRSVVLPAMGRPRTAQLLLKAQLAYRTWRRGDRPARVSPDDFRDNLGAMARLSRAHGIVPIFLTAPSSHERGREPEFLARRFLTDVSELVPLHQLYVSIVRETARSEGAVLCDLAARFEAFPPKDLRERYFLTDGIHARLEGGEKIAEFLQECFERDDELRALWDVPKSDGESG